MPYSRLGYTSKEMIKTGYASDFKKNDPRPANSGTVILITRGRPFPWLDYDEWQRVLSPQKETKDRWLNSKKTEQDWKIYLDDFNPQMKVAKPVEAIERLRRRVKNGETITLLCYCKPEDHCHRNIIKSLIKSNTSNKKKVKGTEAKSKTRS
jgi:uncharacterized protein YeaO (DUF488 family)